MTLVILVNWVGRALLAFTIFFYVVNLHHGAQRAVPAQNS